MMRWFCLFLLACAAPKDDGSTDPETDPADDAIDLRGEFPEAPAGGLALEPPDHVIPAFSERQFCWFTRYEGPDVGIHYQATYQSDHGHHVVLMRTLADEDDFPDDMVFDCTGKDTLPMTEMEPIIFGRGIDDGDGTSSLELTDGMAVDFEADTRLVIQSHYINPTPDDILVRDAIHLGFTDPEDVQTWAAPFAHTAIDFEVPAKAEETVEFDCTWGADATVLFLGGHMHEWGKSFSLDWNTAEETERIYEIEQWEPDYRDRPPINEYEDGSFQVSAGDSFTTSCTWDNTTDEPLGFPEEMCVTFGFAYESKIPLICAPL
jgi:hypothetical protein